MICVKYGMLSSLVKTGCQWRMLPSNFARGSWFTIIIANGVLWVNLICY